MNAVDGSNEADAKNALFEFFEANPDKNSATHRERRVGIRYNCPRPLLGGVSSGAQTERAALDWEKDNLDRGGCGHGPCGCSASGPVAVIAPGGQVLRGMTTSSLAGGDFTVSAPGLSCTGQFDPAPGSRTVSITARCTDGRVGIGRALRDSPQSGSGTITMNDGSEAKFVFGAAAAGF